MSLMYEELDFRPTPIGDLLLRRRRLIQLGGLDIYEVKLGEHFLMTSLFHEAEVQLAKIGLGLLEKETLDVVIGGLGLGYTAVSALEDARVKSLVVVEYLDGVIEWHQNGLVPLGKQLMEDPRCRFVHADFFAQSRNISEGFDPENPEKSDAAEIQQICRGAKYPEKNPPQRKMREKSASRIPEWEPRVSLIAKTSATSLELA